MAGMAKFLYQVVSASLACHVDSCIESCILFAPSILYVNFVFICTFGKVGLVHSAEFVSLTVRSVWLGAHFTIFKPFANIVVLILFWFDLGSLQKPRNAVLLLALARQ